MAHGGHYDTLPGLVAGQDLSSSQYLIVKVASTAGAVIVATTAATDFVLGVLQNNPTAGQPAEVAFQGVAKVKAAASVTFGSQLTTNSTGQAKTSTTDGNRAIGKALAASSSAGDIIPVALSLHDIYLA